MAVAAVHAQLPDVQRVAVRHGLFGLVADGGVVGMEAGRDDHRQVDDAADDRDRRQGAEEIAPAGK
jgi:hypothetical protein